jgi:hypothetical protein
VRMKPVIAILLGVLALPAGVRAEPAGVVDAMPASIEGPLTVSFAEASIANLAESASDKSAAEPLASATLAGVPAQVPIAVPFARFAQQAPPARPVAVEYSDGYHTRLKIHYIASFATLPLFGIQLALGTKLYDGEGGSSTRTKHKWVATSIAGLFGVNSVTGVWNLIESRKDPAHRAKRLAHGLMMLGADAGFVATGLLAPDDEDGSGNRSAHRAVAITSMAVASASYLMMLFTR